MVGKKTNKMVKRKGKVDNFVSLCGKRVKQYQQHWQQNHQNNPNYIRNGQL